MGRLAAALGTGAGDGTGGSGVAAVKPGLPLGGSESDLLKFGNIRAPPLL
ncbi:hypothetical protein APY04_0931 [Hyphomicrobium sulfonivorans]|uniref:Uncharacterized protein n=1 Tax=Hyphomicrobium sulfonivorans TaxID=121290 RepID=A0A109BM27_HYPSL|nr:hypothetical protein APY04_0931 [Hyphomicrobium sulfonivorans]